MADPTVKLVFAGNSAEADRMIIGLEKRLNGLEQNLKRTAKTAKELDFNPFQKMDEGALSLVGRFATIASAGAIVVKTLNDIAEASRKAADAQKNAAPAVEGLASNLPADLTLAEAEKHVERISRKTGVDPDQVRKSLGSAFSAKGQLSTQEAIEAVEVTSSLFPNSPEMQDLLTGSVMDIRKARPGVSNEEALGFLKRGLGQARLTNLKSFSQNLAPAIVGMSLEDSSPKALEENAGFLAALSQVTGDTEGAKTRTAGAAMAAQLRTFFGAKGEGRSNLELMQEIGDSEKLFKDFFEGTKHAPSGEKFEGASFERQMTAPIKAILTKGTQQNKNWASALEGMGDIKTADELDFASLVEQMGANSLLQGVKLPNKLAALTKLKQQGNTKGGAWNWATEGIETAMQSADVPWDERLRYDLGRRIDRMMGYSAEESAMRGLNDLQGRANTNANMGGLGSQPSAEWKEISNSLREIRDLTREHIAATKGNKPDDKPQINRNAQQE